jgi:hypothetical protein
MPLPPAQKTSLSEYTKNMAILAARRADARPQPVSWRPPVAGVEAAIQAASGKALHRHPAARVGHDMCPPWRQVFNLSVAPSRIPQVKNSWPRIDEGGLPGHCSELSSRKTRHRVVFSWQTQFAGAAHGILPCHPGRAGSSDTEASVRRLGESRPPSSESLSTSRRASGACSVSPPGADPTRAR